MQTRPEETEGNDEPRRCDDCDNPLDECGCYRAWGEATRWEYRLAFLFGTSRFAEVLDVAA
jgi:hypothetical protein